MNIKHKRSAIIGAVTGFVIAVVIVLLARFNDYIDSKEILQSIINFSAGPPVFFIVLLKWPENFHIIALFAYWVLLGSVLGGLITLKSKGFKVAVLILLAGGLIILHMFSQVNMERELDKALNVIGEVFTKSRTANAGTIDELLKENH